MPVPDHERDSPNLGKNAERQKAKGEARRIGGKAIPWVLAVATVMIAYNYFRYNASFSFVGNGSYDGYIVTCQCDDSPSPTDQIVSVHGTVKSRDWFSSVHVGDIVTVNGVESARDNAARHVWLRHCKIVDRNGR